RRPVLLGRRAAQAARRDRRHDDAAADRARQRLDHRTAGSGRAGRTAFGRAGACRRIPAVDRALLRHHGAARPAGGSACPVALARSGGRHLHRHIRPHPTHKDLIVFPQRLTDGYRSFLQGRLATERARYLELAEKGQHPDIMVISCGDSRVAPETIFDAGPGDMFVVRNIAGIVPPCDEDPETAFHGTSACVEFAVNALEVGHIVVMGHASCGGVAAYANQAAPLSKRDFIGKWMSQIKPVAEAVGPCTGDRAEWIRRMEWGVVEYSMRNLTTFPAVRERVEAGTLAIHGAYFGVATGVLFVRNPQTGRFEPYAES